MILWIRTEQGKVRHVAEGPLLRKYRVRSVCGSIQANFQRVDRGLGQLMSRYSTLVHYTLDAEEWHIPVCAACADEMTKKCNTIAEQMRRTGAGAG